MNVPNTDVILFANEAFYTAFSSGDSEAMDDLWARETSIVCIHPGNPPLYEREKIIHSWRQILSDPGVSKMRTHSARVVSEGPVALVTCFETFDTTTLAATNGFVKEHGVWRIVHHQAGLCNDEIPIPDDMKTDGPLH